jgi:hypothetical protein
VGGSSVSTLLVHTETGLTTGKDYMFRVRASNSFGWGEYSDSVTITADEVPAQITPIVSSVETINVRIAWSLPSTDNGAAIEEYRIYIIAQDGSIVISCDGQDTELVQSTTPSCIVFMSDLRQIPYSLTQGDLVEA